MVQAVAILISLTANSKHNMTRHIQTCKRYKFQQIAAVLIAILLCGCNSGCHADITRDNGKQIHSAKDIKGKKIGVQLGTTSDVLVSNMETADGGDTQVERFTKSADAIQALLQGKVDCIITDEEPAVAFVEKNPSLKILPENFGKSGLAICISKGNKRLLDSINKAIIKLKDEGMIDSITNGFIKQHKPQVYKKKTNIKRDGKLKFGTNATFKPFEYYNAGRVVGIDIDIAQAICDILGKELEVVEMEFDAIITSVQTGKVDAGIAGITVTEERKKSVLFSDEYTDVRQVVVVNTGDNINDSSMNLTDRFKSCFLTDHRYNYIFTGLANTLIITFFAIILSLILGTGIAIIRSTYERNGSHKIVNAICKVYLTVVRGTPTMVQLLIIYYVVFASVDVNKILVAIIAFGLNSAAYIAEIIRSGIMSVDTGQMEAGRSLGMNYSQTMRLIVLPQAFKNVLPAIGNELITLLKETSISGYIGLVDLTKGSDIIRSITYDAMLPLGIVAAIYLCIVMSLTYGVNKLEKKLRESER